MQSLFENVHIPWIENPLWELRQFNTPGQRKTRQHNHGHTQAAFGRTQGNEAKLNYLFYMTFKNI